MKYLIDLDGTMYHGKKIIPSAKKWIETLNEKGIEYLFFTNNAARTKQQAAEHMLNMGFENITGDMFYTSAMAACEYIKDNYIKRNAFFIGELGLEEALITNGFTIVEDEIADFVFVGLDRKADYAKYSKAVKHLINGAVLVGTNSDRLLMTESGSDLGNGSVVAMFEYASSSKSIKIGKPYSPILESVLKKTGWNKDEVVIVGDNLETDILLGVNENIKTVFVETGVHTKEDIDRLNIHPTYIVKTLLDLDI